MMPIRAPLFVCLILLGTVSAVGTQSPRPRTIPQVAFDVTEKSIEDLQAAQQSGVVNARQLAELFLARIAAYDKQGPALNSIVALNPEALATADALDAERKAGRVRGPLHGIPVVVKDNYETIEMPTAAGSIALATFHPRSDAFQVRRLKEAGAVIIGKTNMHELAAGITTISSSGGQTKNPYDLGRNPGGSSGGTGAAIAANFAVAGMGSDTCGSIRNPASQNNLVGLRGTHGLSSRSGIVPLSTTQDIGGPIARSMTDLAIMLDATVGNDPADPITRLGDGRIPRFRDALSKVALKGQRLGVIRTVFGSAPEDQEVATVVQKSLDLLKKEGAEVVDVVVPGLDELLQGSSVINSEFKFDLAEYLARHQNPPVRSLGEILDRGLYHAALESNFRARNAPEKKDTDQYRRALVKRTALRHALTAVLDEHRLVALVHPTLRRKPARIGDAQAGTTCQVSSHSGLPALGLPSGFTDDGLPVGMELLGREFSDGDLVALGFAIEQVLTPRRPPFSTPALVAGKAPAPTRIAISVGELLYDGTTAALSYRFDLERLTTNGATAVWIHRVENQKPAAALHQLFAGAGSSSAGSVVLSFGDRRALAEGRLILRIYDRKGRVIDEPITVPR